MNNLKMMMRKLDWQIFIILALPWLLLLIDDSWIYSRPWLDQWIYHGYFNNFWQYLKQYPGFYYSARLPFLIPGYICYSTFPPVVANYVLHLVFYYAAILSIFYIVKAWYGGRAGIVIAVLTGCYPFFLEAIGHDYVDGAGITYFLLALLFLTLSSDSIKQQNPGNGILPARCSPTMLTPGRCILLFSAGLAIAAMIFTHLFLVIFTPVLLLYYFLVIRAHSKLQFSAGLGLITAGFIGLTAILGAVNIAAGAGFFFFLQQIDFAQRFNSQANAIFKLQYDAIWLVWPLAVCISSVVVLCINLVRGLTHRVVRFDLRQFICANFFSLSYIYLLLVMLIVHIYTVQPVFQLMYYASYLIPCMFLALASQSSLQLSKLSSTKFSIFAGFLLVLSILTYYPPLDNLLDGILADTGMLYLPLLSGFALAGIFLLQIPVKSVKSTFALVIAAVIVLNFANLMIVARLPNIQDCNGLITPDDISKKNNFMTVQKGMPIIKDFLNTPNPLFWFSRNEKYSYVYYSLSMTGNFPNLISDSFPLFQGCCQPMNIKETNARKLLGSNVVLLTTDEGAFDKATESLNKFGLSADLLGDTIIHQGDIKFRMIFLRVTDFNSSKVKTERLIRLPGLDWQATGGWSLKDRYLIDKLDFPVYIYRSAGGPGVNTGVLRSSPIIIGDPASLVLYVMMGPDTTRQSLGLDTNSDGKPDIHYTGNAVNSWDRWDVDLTPYINKEVNIIVTDDGSREGEWTMVSEPLTRPP